MSSFLRGSSYPFLISVLLTMCFYLFWSGLYRGTVDLITHTVFMGPLYLKHTILLEVLTFINVSTARLAAVTPYKYESVLRDRIQIKKPITEILTERALIDVRLKRICRLFEDFYNSLLHAEFYYTKLYIFWMVKRFQHSKNLEVYLLFKSFQMTLEVLLDS